MKVSGSTFDNSGKETIDALNWFRENLYIKDNVLYWGESTSGRKRSKDFLNKPAGCLSIMGYIQVRMGIDKFMAHRIIWAIHHGYWPSLGIDHINGEKTDNRIENMRETTQFDNSKNAAKYPRVEAWIATGVFRRGKRWYARAQVDKNEVSLGGYSCHTAAMIARRLFDQTGGFTERHGT